MKRIVTLIVIVITLVVCATISRTGAEERPVAAKNIQQWEYALVKWDGPDKIEYIYPDHCEFVRMKEQGYELPKNIEDEQYYVTMGANKMAKEGWEAINLDSRRILFRRPVRSALP